MKFLICTILILSFTSQASIFGPRKIKIAKADTRPQGITLVWTNFPLIDLNSADYSTGIEASQDFVHWTEVFRADYNYGEWQVILPCDKPYKFFRAFNGPKIVTPVSNAFRPVKGRWIPAKKK